MAARRRWRHSKKVSRGDYNCPELLHVIIMSIIIVCCSLKLDYVDMYLMHSPSGGKTLETWDTMLELKSQGLIRYSF